MVDMEFGGPSFSLGLDLDIDFDKDLPLNSPTRKSPPTEEEEEEEGEEEEEVFQLHEDPDLHDPPPSLKRLRRRPPSPLPSRHFEDEIEDFSSQEDLLTTDEQPSLKNYSACRSSKLSLHSQRVLATQSSANQFNSEGRTLASSSVTFASLKGSSGNCTRPMLSIRPIRRIQLLDSDSDDHSDQDQAKSSSKCHTSTKGRQCPFTQSVEGNQQNMARMLSNTLPRERLRRDFSPKKNTKLATPAFDEFCEEYFGCTKDKNVDHREKGDVGNSRHAPLTFDQYVHVKDDYYQGNSIHEDSQLCANQNDAISPAYRYFYHNDSRIRKLVRDRLGYFFPIGAVNHGASYYSEAIAIDYMSQFGHTDYHSEVHVRSKKREQGSSQTKKRSRNSENQKKLPQASEGWVNPRTPMTTPKNAGKRRVRADGHSAGHWYTAQNGRKVYVNRNGQELTGRAAYGNYKKDSGARSRNSRKKVSSKKKKKSRQ